MAIDKEQRKKILRCTSLVRHTCTQRAFQTEGQGHDRKNNNKTTQGEVQEGGGVIETPSALK